MKLDAVHGRRLTLADANGLQALLERCGPYFRAADGHPPDKHAALTRIADALGDSQLELWGFGESAILELRRDEPSVDEATVVLLLIEPAQRRRGLGRQIVDALIAELRGSGVTALHLGVQDHEEGAHGFWAALGFLPDGREEGVTRYVLPLRS